MKQGRYIKRLEDPKIARMLFGEVKWAWIWIPLRLYAGWQWLIAGWNKLGNPVWTGDSAGAAVTGFVTGALEKTGGAHPDVQGWYAWFLKNMVLPNAGLWSQFVAYGELLVGIALILGVFTGMAAFFGGFMNMNYLLAGTVSTNPLLLAIAIFLILAWKTAGWWGIDRWLLPMLGTPWRPGFIFMDEERDSSLEMEENPA
jgi:thiosulfate dehydrogenase [quinone] large subunit